MSIAYLEEKLSQETIVRIASNSEIRKNTLDQLRELINVLNRVASKDIFLFYCIVTKKRIYCIDVIVDRFQYIEYIYQNSNQNSTTRHNKDTTLF